MGPDYGHTAMDKPRRFSESVLDVERRTLLTSERRQGLPDSAQAALKKWDSLLLLR